MTDSLTPFDDDLAAADMVELRAVAPACMDRLVPDWEAVQTASLHQAMRGPSSHAVALRRAGGLVAAAAVVAAVGTTIALGAPESMHVVPRAAACETAVSGNPSVPHGTVAVRARQDGTRVALRLSGSAVGVDALVQLVDGSGAPLTVPQQSHGKADLLVTAQDLCGGHIWAEVSRGTTSVRVAAVGAGHSRWCVETGVDLTSRSC